MIEQLKVWGAGAGIEEFRPLVPGSGYPRLEPLLLGSFGESLGVFHAHLGGFVFNKDLVWEAFALAYESILSLF